jgi:hypothetical protein
VDLCNLDDVKKALGLEASEADWDETIAAWIPRAGEAVADWAGRQFHKDTGVSARVFDADPAIDTRCVFIGDLSDTPSAVEILDTSGAVAATLNVAADVKLLPRVRTGDRPIRMLELRPSAPRLLPGQELRVTGVWGWPQIPAAAREATVEVIREWLRYAQAVSNQAPEAEDAGFTARGLPLKARRLLAPHRGPVFA